MAFQYENALSTLAGLDLHARQAQIVQWGERQALMLDGLAILPDVEISNARIEVDIAAEAAAYPGIAFRLFDPANYELAYAQPHTSQQWDAIQYDPVFHGSNTWQLYHGDAYQKAALVPLSQWFTLRIDCQGEHAAIYVDQQPPLLIRALSHAPQTGRLALWTYLPAYFSNLRISAPMEITPGVLPEELPGTVTAWFVEGFGVVHSEPGGFLNLNRCLPVSQQEVRLTRRFEVQSDDLLEIRFGFSDRLSLHIDEQVLFEGETSFKGFGGYAERGYVQPGQHQAVCRLSPGVHRLTATLTGTEYFGWGLHLGLSGGQVQLLPEDLG